MNIYIYSFNKQINKTTVVACCHKNQMIIFVDIGLRFEFFAISNILEGKLHGKYCLIDAIHRKDEKNLINKKDLKNQINQDVKIDELDLINNSIILENIPKNMEYLNWGKVLSDNIIVIDDFIYKINREVGKTVIEIIKGGCVWIYQFVDTGDERGECFQAPTERKLSNRGQGGRGSETESKRKRVWMTLN